MVVLNSNHCNECVKIMTSTTTEKLNLSPFNFSSKHQNFIVSHIFDYNQHPPLPSLCRGLIEGAIAATGVLHDERVPCGYIADGAPLEENGHTGKNHTLLNVQGFTKCPTPMPATASA
ncbi:hypothetical protein F2Q69_00006374 [Brassica cretica]|uniref:Uncharacterized protein n=1 Tax=Brassica cretica TaxID=69181 RepID=A0A8S9P1B2_BRACR|nr:hypothetical protein F2Q69_00006374 [Brassica cretica]